MDSQETPQTSSENQSGTKNPDFNYMDVESNNGEVTVKLRVLALLIYLASKTAPKWDDGLLQGVKLFAAQFNFSKRFYIKDKK